jgi:hypothetical protein
MLTLLNVMAVSAEYQILLYFSLGLPYFFEDGGGHVTFFGQWDMIEGACIISS